MRFVEADEKIFNAVRDGELDIDIVTATLIFILEDPREVEKLLSGRPSASGNVHFQLLLKNLTHPK